jgi:hypothetical protein
MENSCGYRVRWSGSWSLTDLDRCPVQNLGTAGLPNLHRMRHQGFHKRKDFLLFLTENRQFHKFIILTMILLLSHDSVLRSTLEGSRARHALVEFAQAGSIAGEDAIPDTISYNPATAKAGGCTSNSYYKQAHVGLDAPRSYLPVFNGLSPEASCYSVDGRPYRDSSPETGFAEVCQISTGKSASGK